MRSSRKIVRGAPGPRISGSIVGLTFIGCAVGVMVEYPAKQQIDAVISWILFTGITSFGLFVVFSALRIGVEVTQSEIRVRHLLSRSTVIPRASVRKVVVRSTDHRLIFIAISPVLRCHKPERKRELQELAGWVWPWVTHSRGAERRASQLREAIESWNGSA